MVFHCRFFYSSILPLPPRPASCHVPKLLSIQNTAGDNTLRQIEMQIANYSTVPCAIEWNRKITTIVTTGGAAGPDLEDQGRLPTGWDSYAEMAHYPLDCL